MPFMDVRGAVETPGVAVTASNAGRLVFGYMQGSAEVLVWQVNTDGTLTFLGTMTQVGNFVVADAVPQTKAYRFRVTGSTLDLEAGGASLFVSVFTGADFTGTQRLYMVLDKDQDLVRAVRKWTWSATDAFGAVVHTIDPAANLATFANVAISPAGGGLRVAEGANAKMGTATLVAGTVTVNTTAVTANSRVFLTAQTSGAAPGALRVSARVAGTSFTITSTNAGDTSSVAWMLVEPA